MDWILRANRFFGELAGTVRDDFVRVRVRARARTSLENIEWKMLVEFALEHFFRGLDDVGATVRVEQTEVGVRLGCSPLDQTERANERARKTLAADGKIQDGPLGGCAIEGRGGNGHLAHRILLDSGRPGRHAE